MKKYAIGIDFGTESGRVLIIDLNGQIVSTSIVPYKDGVITSRLPIKKSEQLPQGFALQNPNNYLDVLKIGMHDALQRGGVAKEEVIGVGISFTSSTVLAVDGNLQPLCFEPTFTKNPHAWVKLWKHHGASEEAALIYDMVKDRKEQILRHYGNTVSAEWFLPKCLETFYKAPEVYEHATFFIEAADWIVSKLVGDVVRSNCTLGYKSFWHEVVGFLFNFFEVIELILAQTIRGKLAGTIKNVGETAGFLTEDMANEISLLPGTPIGTAIIDAHSSLLGIGAKEEKQLTMVMGTSTCHLMLNKEQKSVKGISGSVYEAIFPNVYAYEAGQPAVGDLFGSYIKQIPKEYSEEAKRQNISPFQYMEQLASKFAPGENKLLALDWMNGNRSVLANFDLTGLIIGLTVKTKPEEVYRALLEATAFGAKTIVLSYEAAGLPIEKIFACGGLPKRNALLMQIYADVLNREVTVSATEQASGVGASVLGAVAGGRFESIYDAVEQMKQSFERVYRLIAENVNTYDKIFTMYEQLYNYFGVEQRHFMKDLLHL